MKYIFSQIVLLIILLVVSFKKQQEIDGLTFKIQQLESKMLENIAPKIEDNLLNEYALYAFFVGVVFLIFFLQKKDYPSNSTEILGSNRNSDPVWSEIRETIVSQNVANPIDTLASKEEFQTLFDIFSN